MFLRRIGGIFCILVSLISAQIMQESDDGGSQIGKWYKFFGVEAGIGSLDVVPAYFATLNFYVDLELQIILMLLESQQI